MLEPLSEPRRRLLVSLNLCTPRDLRRARSRVRQLARDLPAFDSVWIDALVQLRRLTPFQARLLESSHPEQVRIGPCVLVDRIGAGPLAETFVARSRRASDQFVAKVLRLGTSLSPAAEERLANLVRRLRGLNSPFVVGPQTCQLVADRFVIISPLVDGHHLGELLVRRGRFPPGVVRELARQLAAGLLELERRGVAHGDLRVDNVRLSPAGQARLVDAGIRGALDSDLSVHSALPPGHFDGVAPERIGSTAGPTTASDLYALGCLLWQLLAGRPPFPAGDPLFKLAAHQSRDIEDVRKWSPETPADLAEGIRALTRRDPGARPQSVAKLAERWGVPGTSGRRVLAAFYRQFDRPAPLPARRDSRSSRGWLAPALILVTMIAGGFALPQSREVLISWGNFGMDQEQTPATSTTEARRVAAISAIEQVHFETSAPERLDELPQPDPLGTIRLPVGRRFRARSLVHVGNLQIVGEQGDLPEIVIDESPWQLTAETITIDGIRLSRRSAYSEKATSSPLVSLRCLSTRLESCLIVGDNVSESPRHPVDALAASGPLLEWNLLSPDDLRTAQIAFRNCLFAGGGPAVVASSAPRIEFLNCLRLGGVALCRCEFPGRRSQSRMILDRTTCRGSRTVFQVVAPREESAQGKLLLETQDCVFDVESSQGSLLEIDSEISPSRIQVSGEGTLVPSQLRRIVRMNPRGEGDDAEPSEIAVEGLISVPYRFAAGFTLNPGDSEIAECDVPRRSSLPPGVVPTDLPGAP